MLWPKRKTKLPCCRFAIDGNFLTKTITGVQRYALEIVSQLDFSAEEGEYVIVVSESEEILNEFTFANIPVIRYGKRRGPLWLQLDFSRFCILTGACPLCLSNLAPIFSSSCLVVHDISSIVNRHFYDWKYSLYCKACTYLCLRRAKLVITDSDFSRREIEGRYHWLKGKVHVISCAWQHVNGFEEDASVIAALQNVLPGNYYFALSSLSPNKNLWWIAETAKLNPASQFVVAGGINERVFGRAQVPRADNIFYVGYVTDEQVKSLMRNCRAFLFPTFYEGFGIPPMEALSCGAEIVVSDTEVMHEIYRQSAHYVNPHEPVEHLDSLLSRPVESPERVLERFSWEKSGASLHALLHERASV